MAPRSETCTLLLLSALAVTVGKHFDQGMDPLVADPLGHHKCFADIVFVLDSSGSVGKQGNWQLMLDFVKAFAYRMHFGPDVNQIAVVTFGNEARVNINLGDHTDHASFNASVDAIPFLDQETNTADAFRKILEQVLTPSGGDRPTFNNVVLVLTDGKPNREETLTIPLANQIKALNKTFIFAIGIGAEGVDFGELDKLASEPQETFLRRIMNFDDLDGILQGMVDDVCSASVAGPSCFNKDIAFVLDSSGSVGKNNFRKVKDFVKAMMENIPLGDGMNQVALVTYSTEAFTHALLDDYNNNEDFIAKVEKLPYVSQRTNISGAIRQTVQEIFLTQKQFRIEKNADVMVLLSDGHDNTDTETLFQDALDARNEGIRIVTIGVGYDSAMARMAEVASRPALYHHFVVRDYDELVSMGHQGHGDSIYDFVCYNPNAYPPEEFSVDNSDCESDITILLDASSNVGQSDFASVCSKLAEQLSRIDVTRRRVAVITFANFAAEVRIAYNSYSNAQQLAVSFRSLPYVGGKGDVMAALDPDLYYSAGSRRQGVVNQVFILTASMRNNGDDAAMRQRMQQLLDHDPVVTRPAHTFLIYTLALSDNINGKALATMLATEPIEQFGFVVTDYRKNGMSEVGGFFQAILARSCIDTAKTLWRCDFEGQQSQNLLCGAENFIEQNLSWKAREGKTASRHTGPDSAFTAPNYLYLEASGRKKGEAVTLQLPVNDVRGPVCLYFLRHLFGYHIGSLQVLVRDDSGHERIMWMQYGPDKGLDSEHWVPTTAQLVLVPGDYVAIRATRGNGFSSDIAIDSVTLKQGPCQLPDTVAETLSVFTL